MSLLYFDALLITSFKQKYCIEMRFFYIPTQGSGFMMVICDRQLVDEVCNQPKGYKAT